MVSILVGRLVFVVEWSFIKNDGLLFWLTKSMADCLYRYLPWRTNTTPILKCVPTRKQLAVWSAKN